MLRFIDDEDLYVAVKHNNADVRYTYYNDYYKLLQPETNYRVHYDTFIEEHSNKLVFLTNTRYKHTIN